MIIQNRFSDFLLPQKNIWGITLWPFVFFRSNKKITKTMVTHERIHLRQQIEMLVIPFYVWYLSEFVIRAIAKHSWQRAYPQISFEREAYPNERNAQYLQKRKCWAFLKYL